MYLSAHCITKVLEYSEVRMLMACAREPVPSSVVTRPFLDNPSTCKGNNNIIDLLKDSGYIPGFWPNKRKTFFFKEECSNSVSLTPISAVLALSSHCYTLWVRLPIKWTKVVTMCTPLKLHGLTIDILSTFCRFKSGWKSNLDSASPVKHKVTLASSFDDWLFGGADLTRCQTSVFFFGGGGLKSIFRLAAKRRFGEERGSGLKFLQYFFYLPSPLSLHLFKDFDASTSIGSVSWGIFSCNFFLFFSSSFVGMRRVLPVSNFLREQTTEALLRPPPLDSFIRCLREGDLFGCFVDWSRFGGKRTPGCCFFIGETEVASDIWVEFTLHLF